MSTSYCNVPSEFSQVRVVFCMRTSLASPVIGVIVAIVRVCARYNNLDEIIRSRYTYLLIIMPGGQGLPAHLIIVEAIGPFHTDLLSPV
jgi:hypothetical protein